jgi:hypothetical protein
MSGTLDYTRDRYGAVVVFPAGTTAPEAERAIAALQKVCVDMRAARAEISGPHHYDSRWGGPAWYIP